MGRDRIEASRYAGQVNQQAIEQGFLVAKPGVTLLEIDAAVEKHILDNGCRPVFKGYKGFPAACCLSPNDVIIHGVPNGYALKTGDILTIDVGSECDSWMVDSARTRVIRDHRILPGLYLVGEALVNAVEHVLEAQLSVVKDGCSLLEIMKKAEASAKGRCFIYPQFGGHQIGQELHVDPFIPNCIDPTLSSIKRWQLEREYDKYKLQAGQIICLEPVVTLTNTDIIQDEDGWTIRTKSGTWASHTERCLLVTETGYEILS